MADNPTTSPPPEGIYSIVKENLTYFMERALDLGSNAPADLIRFIRYPSAPVNQEDALTFLGTEYPSPGSIEFLEDFQTRLWMTYRSDFSPIKALSFTSDAGWGCMLRSGQMLLANALMQNELGRDWRIRRIEEEDSAMRYTAILMKFLDSPLSPYSIHRISLQGRQFEKEVGVWYGPSTISQVLKVLVKGDPSASLGIHVSQDGTLYINDVLKDFQQGERPLLILIPILLGLESYVNPVYFDHIKKCFTIKSCVGISGGRPNSSLYFCGYQGENLIYLDPHVTRPSIPYPSTYTTNTPTGTSKKGVEFVSFHCDKPRYLKLSAVDPSMVLGFMVKNTVDFEQFLKDVKEITSGKSPLFSVAKDPLMFTRGGSSGAGPEEDILSDDE